MKKIFLPALVIICICSNAQMNNLTITPGVGVGKLKLGMSEKQAIAILKGEPTWAGYKTTMQTYKETTDEGSFAIDSMLIYVQGFDTMANYENGAGNTPIMNLFFKAHKLNYISLSSYIVEDISAIKVKLSNGIKFKDNLSTVKSKMKVKPLNVKYGTMTANLIYYNEGVEMIIDENLLTFIAIFPKQPKFLQSIKANAARLKKEYSMLNKNED